MPSPTNPYIITLADPAQLPNLIKGKFLQGYAQSRVAFVGRSNVGKSSLINALMQEKVARVSATPGKTRAIHFFVWQKANRIIADLPGYGFAKRSKEEQRSWSVLLDSYFAHEEALEVVLMLFDSRHGPTDSDLEALEFFSLKGVPIQIVMTKFDQLKTQSDRAKRKKEVLQSLSGFELDESQITWVSINDQKSIERLRDLFI